jgi:hypothetical protein
MKRDFIKQNSGAIYVGSEFCIVKSVIELSRNWMGGLKISEFDYVHDALPPAMKVALGATQHESPRLAVANAPFTVWAQ